MPLSRWAQRSDRVALGAAALGLGPRTASRTSPPAPAPLTTAPVADDGADDVALVLRTAVGTIDAAAIDTISTDAADAVGRLTAGGARPPRADRRGPLARRPLPVAGRGPRTTVPPAGRGPAQPKIEES